MSLTNKEPIILNGKSLANEMKVSMKEELKRLIEDGAQVPTLATILVGNNPASTVYVQMKINACKNIGIKSQHVLLAENTSTTQLLSEIDSLNNDPNITGILLQHPSPPQIDERLAFDRILPEKDIDGVNSLNFAKISLGLPAFPSCTPAGIIKLLDHYEVPIQGAHAVVIGRSPILGLPMSMLFMRRNASVSICHSYTKDLASHLKHADIVVAACGKANFVKGEWLKSGVCLVDAGYNKGNVGDVDYGSCKPVTSYITPVPGGVGPMTITMLLKHSLEATRQNLAKA